MRSLSFKDAFKKFYGPAVIKIAEPKPKSDIDVYFDNGIKVCHAIGENGGGVTLAYRKATDFKNCRMVDVAAVYCSPHDVFSRKVGTRLALHAFASGKTVQVPARFPSDAKYSEINIPTMLKLMFWYSVR